MDFALSETKLFIENDDVVLQHHRQQKQQCHGNLKTPTKCYAVNSGNSAQFLLKFRETKSYIH